MHILHNYVIIFNQYLTWIQIKLTEYECQIIYIIYIFSWTDRLANLYALYIIRNIPIKILRWEKKQIFVLSYDYIPLCMSWLFRNSSILYNHKNVILMLITDCKQYFKNWKMSRCPLFQYIKRICTTSQ